MHLTKVSDNRKENISKLVLSTQNDPDNLTRTLQENKITDNHSRMQTKLLYKISENN